MTDIQQRSRREKKCDAHGCTGVATLSNYCGAYVCGDCGKHVSLTRCYCGWSESGRDGRAELIEMGEVIDDPDQ